MYFNKGLSVSEIEKRTTHSRNTITKYIEQEDFNKKSKSKEKGNKSDLIRPFVRAILLDDKLKRKKMRHTAKRIYERAQIEVPQLCQIKSRTMRKIVSEEKYKLYNDNECFLDLVHPGGEAQVDFGEIEIYEDGKLVKSHEFVLTFPASNAGFCQITRSETMEAVCESMASIFEHIGKVPSKIWFDQMAAACLRQKDDKGNVIANPRFQKFAQHYGFDIIFCNPYSGNEKGAVENKVGYFRNNLFIPEVNVHDLSAYNKTLLESCDKDNERMHYKHKQHSIHSLFLLEKERMQLFNPISFDHAREEKHHVYKNGHMRVDGNTYSVSPNHASEKVIVKYYANELIVYDLDYREITRHRRYFDKGGKYTHWVDFITLISRRPKALKYTEFYNLLPNVWRDYVSNLEKESLREALHFLKHCLLEKDFDFATAVVSENVKQNVLEPNALWTTYYRMTEDQSLYLSKHENSLPSLPNYKIQLEEYDLLMGGVQC